MLLGRSILANFSSASGLGVRVGLLENMNETVCGSAQAKGLHLKMRCVPFADRCAFHLSGSGARVVTRMLPGLVGFAPSSPALCANANPGARTKTQRDVATQWH